MQPEQDPANLPGKPSSESPNRPEAIQFSDSDSGPSLSNVGRESARRSVGAAGDPRHRTMTANKSPSLA